MTSLLALPNRAKWTVEEFDRLSELGAFADRKVELLDGEFFDKMTQLTPHAVAVRLMDKVLNARFGEGFDVRCQLPMTLELSKPEPDFAVVVGQPRDYLESHPSTALLVVEVSDTTLQTDRDVKTPIYARAGVAEYWIVDLNARRLEVRREPRADATQPLGFGYRTLLSLNETDVLAPLVLPEASFAIADVLP